MTTRLSRPLQNYTKAVDDEPRNFEPMSNDGKDSLATKAPFPNFHTILTCFSHQRRFKERSFISCLPKISWSGRLERLRLCPEAWRVVGRLEGGQTQAEVAQAIGVSQRVISGSRTVFGGLEVQAEDQDNVVDGKQRPMKIVI
ncbi:hypothetical protein TNCV_181981 [Trichonephila clavipes]|nr:hypothetical protein TNCV_181981 [Trichonephila clavipes]